jgi:hypothetical protein
MRDQYSYPTRHIQCMLLQHGRPLTSYLGTTRYQGKYWYDLFQNLRAVVVSISFLNYEA